MSTETANTVEAVGAILCVLLAVHFVLEATLLNFRKILDYISNFIHSLRMKIKDAILQRKVKRHARKAWGNDEKRTL